MARSPLFRQLKRNISRREFLNAIGVSALAYPLLPVLSRMSAAQDPVLILGGGLAGLTAAYTLQKAGTPYLLFEAKEQWGGRVFTLNNFNSDHQYIELGAELIDTNHLHLQALTRELGLELEQLSSRETNSPSEIFYCDGQIYSKRQFQKSVYPFMQLLRRDYHRLFPDRPTYVTYKTAHRYPQAGQLDNTSLADYLDSYRPHVDHWLLKIVRAGYESEFGLPAEEQSALNLLFFMGAQDEKGSELFGDSNQSHHIKGGNGRLVTALSEKLATKNVYLNHQLVELRENSSSLQCTFQTPSGLREFKTSRMICTLPFSTLRNVSGVDKLPLSPQKQKSIFQLGYGTNSKLMLDFNQRFWSPPAKPQLYGEMIGTFQSQSFWETSRKQRGHHGILTNFFSCSPQAQQVEIALQDLTQIFPQARAQFANKHMLVDWTNQPYARGSYACLKTGQHTTLCGSAGEPELGGKLLFAGEHTSIEYQGFMEGAIETALTAVRQCTYSA